MSTIRIVRNRHGSAAAALRAWQHSDEDKPKRGLWGNPIQLGPDSFQVYGANRRIWRPVSVEFTPERIIVIRVGRR